MQNTDPTMLSAYNLSKIGHGASSVLKIESLQSVTGKLKTSYHYVKGKSFDNRLVFSPQCAHYAVKVVRWAVDNVFWFRDGYFWVTINCFWSDERLIQLEKLVYAKPITKLNLCKSAIHTLVYWLPLLCHIVSYLKWPFNIIVHFLDKN